MTDFLQLKRTLNKEQLLAVEQIEGPVMVIAGPGTGKTQTVALRIAQILEQTHVQATNILALTFTEVGVTALRERLTEIIGPLAYRITINTFHGFANEVISSFPHIFSLKRDLTQLDNLERLLLIEGLIVNNKKLSLLRPLRKETTHVRSVAETIRQAKQEAVTPDQLRLLAKKELDSVPNLKTKAAKEKAERQGKLLLEFADVFESYAKELTNQSLYDYEDMILLVIKALEENTEIKAYFQERYQYILVDEYQDTNTAQNRLVELLADFFSTPNLFVVGDDKQAIYRFQGASVANMLHFYHKYPELKIISLQQNYRSSPEILAAAAKLISGNERQLSSQLPSVNAELTAVKKSGPVPKVITASTQLAEQLELVKQLRDANKRGVAWEQMAVLFRTNLEANEFRNIAEKAGLQVAGLQTTDLLREREIQLLLQILRAVINPRDDVSVTAALRMQGGSKHLLSLLELISLAREKKQKIIETVFESENTTFTHLAEQLLAWNVNEKKLGLVEILEGVLYGGGVLDAIRARPDRLSGLELIAALVDNARQFAERHQSANLKDWLDYLDLHGSYNLKFSLNRCRAETTGIFINTVHQAKGLEFEVVFIPYATEKNWRPKADRSLIKLPSQVVELDNWQEDPLEDLRRLFYVALTRAKRQLIFSYATTDSSGRPQLSSELIAEIEGVVTFEQAKASDKELEQFLSTQLTPLPDSVISRSELEYIREHVRQNPFSFTAYWDYKTCPQSYLLKHVYKLPTPFTPALAYGEAIHRALELFERDHKNFKKLPSKAGLLGYFDQAIRQNLPFGDRDQYLAQGLKVLDAYYDQFSSSWIPPLEVEYSFRAHQVMLDDAWLTGKVDQISLLDSVTQAVRVTDYKSTTDSRSRNYIEGGTQDSDGKMKAQLVFYALLSSLDPRFPYKAKEFEIAFIDDKLSFKTEKFVITKEEIEALSKDITTTFQEILTRTDFSHSRDSFDKGCEICAAFPTL